MTIFTTRLAAGAAAYSVEARVRPLRVYSTHPSTYGSCCWSIASTSSRFVSRSGLALHRSSHTPRRSLEVCFGDVRLRIGKACRRCCPTGGELLRLRRGRREKTVATCGQIVNQCPLRRYAIAIKSQLLAACILGLGTMSSRRDGWKRAGAGGAVEQQRRKKLFTTGAFADDDTRPMSEASPLSNGKSNKIVPPPLRPTKLLTLPTILTLARVAAVPAILAVFYCKEAWATAAGVLIFILAAVTDWLDGYLARKMGSSSAFGAFLDPVADKLMVATALVLLCTRPLPISGFAATPWLLPVPTIAIIGREITMSAVREWAAAQGADVLKAVAVNNLGKIKTASQMTAVTLLLATGDGGLDSIIASHLGIALLYVAAGLGLWSLAMYMKGIWGSLGK